MGDEQEPHRSRTVLELLIRERRQTFEEFAEFATNFARECGEPGTLSGRHVKRLASGRGDGGKPLGRPQQATVRLLERIFGVNIEELLGPPLERREFANDEREFRALLRTSARIDGTVLQLLRDQLNATRRLDRQLGAILAHDEVVTKIGQVGRLMGHSVMPTTREELAALLSELRTLAGWQALDLGNVSQSWQHYEQGKLAAKEPPMDSVRRASARSTTPPPYSRMTRRRTTGRISRSTPSTLTAGEATRSRESASRKRSTCSLARSTVSIRPSSALRRPCESTLPRRSRRYASVIKPTCTSTVLRRSPPTSARRVSNDASNGLRLVSSHARLRA
jgi:hypothetical protein